MSSFFSDDSPSNQAEYSVTELSGSIKRTIETNFEQVRVRGEISGYRGPHSSGHAYFSLKDDRSRIDAVIWKGSFGRLKFKPEEGMEVIATGKVTTFPGSSKYQIVIEQMEPAGAGAMMALIEERRQKLAAEGLFDATRKKALPFLPRVIGVVTSPTGAVIRDILHRLNDRFPLSVLVWPVRVQGEGSGEEVAAAINGFNALVPGGAIPRPDVLIVARGGGSLEDLWSFNDEIVVRAAASSAIPLISAVGHETDWTLIDHAADRRAPTPTGAAEMAVPVKADLEAAIASLAARLQSASGRQMDNRQRALQSLGRALPSLDSLLALPRRRFDETAAALGRSLELSTLSKRARFDRAAGALRPDAVLARIMDRRQVLTQWANRADRTADRLIDRQRLRVSSVAASLRGLPVRLAAERSRQSERLAGLEGRAGTALANRLARARQRLDGQSRVLQSLSFREVLRRGYAVIRDDSDKVVTGVGQVGADTALSIEWSDGRINVQTVSPSGSPSGSPPGSSGAASAGSGRRAARQPATPKGGQGSLF